MAASFSFTWGGSLRERGAGAASPKNSFFPQIYLFIKFSPKIYLCFLNFSYLKTVLAYIIQSFSKIIFSFFSNFLNSNLFN